MAWYPGATRMELQPESDAQPAITPTQFIVHSIAAPWTKERIYEYWRDSTNLESHFGQSYDGSIAQFIGTQTRADANFLANRRPDGTGAVSIETASNLHHTDPWTPEQVEGLIRLGLWLHRTHDIPLRICRTSEDPGYGYHRLHAAWSDGGTACPGDARVKQFRETVFPAIVARATGQPTTPAPTAPTQEDPVPSMLNLSNSVDYDLTGGAWTTLAFATDGVIHPGPRRHLTLVHLLFDPLLVETEIEGRYYLTDADGANRSNYLPTLIRAAGGEGVGGYQFSCTGDVPAGRTLRYEVRVTTPDGTPARLLHRTASGPYWAL
ncbi:N-acetylmuramoyl-L-alanine amidase [Streptomyces sp. NPDC050504]|uniref:N-acetylmuramoyl-L-alanine amidase n=1 Tax=Streptomyces sp. NPDC050504 TaxID=3365618 RepID=UPI00379B4404